MEESSLRFRQSRYRAHVYRAGSSTRAVYRFPLPQRVHVRPAGIAGPRIQARNSRSTPFLRRLLDGIQTVRSASRHPAPSTVILSSPLETRREAARHFCKKMPLPGSTLTLKLPHRRFAKGFPTVRTSFQGNSAIHSVSRRDRPGPDSHPAGHTVNPRPFGKKGRAHRPGPPESDRRCPNFEIKALQDSARPLLLLVSNAATCCSPFGSPSAPPAVEKFLRSERSGSATHPRNSPF